MHFRQKLARNTDSAMSPGHSRSYRSPLRHDVVRFSVLLAVGFWLAAALWSELDPENETVG